MKDLRFAVCAALTLVLGRWGLPVRAEEPPAAAMRERAGRWLAAWLSDGGNARVEDLAVAVGALSRLDARGPAGAVSRGRAALRGLIAAGRLDQEASGAAPWLALLALEGSGDSEDEAAARRVKDKALGDRTAKEDWGRDLGGGDEGTREALKFLSAARTNVLTRGALTGQDPYEDDLELHRLAGGPIDAREAYGRLVAAAGSNQWPPADGWPWRGGGEVYRLHLAARVLARYRSPRLVTGDGQALEWPKALVERLRASWSEREGAFADAPGGTASPVATASGVLALEALAPWTGLEALLGEAESAEPSRPAELRKDCVDCHRELQPGLVVAWEESVHREAGVGCDACHGANHSRTFRENGRVSARVCGACHERQTAELAGSRHAAAESNMLASALFRATPAAAREACFGCHRIGAAHTDGSRGSCNFCHPGHGFSAAVAREPEACTGCHAGEDHPQDTAYWTSKHGALYARDRDSRRSPTCVTCHQPRGAHGDGFGITLGGSGKGGVLAGESAPIPLRVVSPEAFAERRAAMVAVCGECHSSRFSEEHLRKADEVKRAGTLLLGEAAEVLKGLDAEWLLGARGARFALGGEQVRLGPGEPGAEVLNLFYDMWRIHYAQTWKGAYHSSPSVAGRRGLAAGLDHDLEAIGAAAERLRAAARGK
ncbi:MAG: hypothetical protein HY721_20205 [Planctomycetes bacterium]|nr:hypothetical protein [Planctomycetota bacterium]